jgi:hypothetical protein
VRRWPGGIIALQKTPVGVEPTSTGLQPVAAPSGSSVSFSASSPGVEPGLRPSQGCMRNPPYSEDVFSFVGPVTNRPHEYPAEESNPVLQIRNLPCNPAHPQGIFL